MQELVITQVQHPVGLKLAQAVLPSRIMHIVSDTDSQACTKKLQVCRCVVGEKMLPLVKSRVVRQQLPAITPVQLALVKQAGAALQLVVNNAWHPQQKRLLLAQFA